MLRPGRVASMSRARRTPRSISPSRRRLRGVPGAVQALRRTAPIERRAAAGRGEVTDVLKRIRALEIKVKHLVDEAFAGSYHSVFKGQGMNFEEVREYRRVGRTNSGSS